MMSHAESMRDERYQYNLDKDVSDFVDFTPIHKSLHIHSLLGRFLSFYYRYHNVVFVWMKVLMFLGLKPTSYFRFQILLFSSHYYSKVPLVGDVLRILKVLSILYTPKKVLAAILYRLYSLVHYFSCDSTFKILRTRPSKHTVL